MSEVELKIKSKFIRCPQCEESLDDWSRLISTKEKGKRYYCDNCEMIVMTEPPKTKQRGYRRIEVMCIDVIIERYKNLTGKEVKLI